MKLPSSIETPLQLLERCAIKLSGIGLTAEQRLEVQIMCEEIGALRAASVIWFAHYAERDPVDSRFAARDVVLDTTPCVPARIARADDDDPCPACAHRMGSHGSKLGCMHIVETGGTPGLRPCSCKVVRE